MKSTHGRQEHLRTLDFAPGEAFQFDWSEDYAFINRVNTKLQVTHFKLSHSQAFLMPACCKPTR